jgi:hypothetical protein
MYYIIYINNYLFIYNIQIMDNKDIDLTEEPNNEKEMTEMLENCTKIMNFNIVFKNKQDKYVFDRLPISAEDKLDIINSILKENADNLKK